MSENKAGLYKKIHAVMCETEGIEKNLTVGFGGNAYKAVGEASVLNEIKPLLKKHGLVLFPIELDVDERMDVFDTAKGSTTRLMTQVKAKYKICDIDTGEYEILETIGNGVDTQDKASGKAMTYALKVLLQKTFMLFSGEDTDNEHSDAITDKNTAPKTSSKPNTSAKPPTKPKVKSEKDQLIEACGEAVQRGKTNEEVKAVLNNKKVADMTPQEIKDALPKVKSL